MRRSVQRQNQRQNQRQSRRQNQRQHNLYGGIPLFTTLKDKLKGEPKVVCTDKQFLYKNTCVEQCPEGTHGDTDCTPHECVSGTRDGFLNSRRAASCRAAKAAKAAFLKKRYDISKAYVIAYEAAMPANGAPPTDAELAKVEKAEEKLESANDSLEQSADNLNPV